MTSTALLQPILSQSSLEVSSKTCLTQSQSQWSVSSWVTCSSDDTEIPPKSFLAPGGILITVTVTGNFFKIVYLPEHCLRTGWHSPGSANDPHCLQADHSPSGILRVKSQNFNITKSLSDWRHPHHAIFRNYRVISFLRKDSPTWPFLYPQAGH